MPSTKTILISVECIAERTNLAETLSDLGYAVRQASCACDALQAVRRTAPDLILADLKGCAHDAYSLVRAFGATIPVLAMGRSSSGDQRVAAFELGAEEFLSLPMDPRELGLRLHKALKRWAGAKAGAKLNFGRFRMNAVERTVSLDGRARTNLTASEFSALQLLVENVGRHVSRSELSAAALHRPHASPSRAVDMLVSKLRSKIRTQRGEELITSVRGAGYAVDPLVLHRSGLKNGPTSVN
jgi:DNA-binding response OmpR family regulator